MKQNRLCVGAFSRVYDGPDAKFEHAVDADLAESATEEQKDLLDSDLRGWKKCVVNRQRYIQNRISEEKSGVWNSVSQRTFEKFKIQALQYLQVLIEKSSELKIALHEDAQDSDGEKRFILDKISGQLDEVLGLLKEGR